MAKQEEGWTRVNIVEEEKLLDSWEKESGYAVGAAGDSPAGDAGAGDNSGAGGEADGSTSGGGGRSSVRRSLPVLLGLQVDQHFSQR